MKATLKPFLQKILLIRTTYNYLIRDINDFKLIDTETGLTFLPITPNNFHRVADFREEERILQYQKKLAQKEIGYFAEREGSMIGSIWATINQEQYSKVVRTVSRLQPKEAIIHDIVTGEKSRGMGVGSFMTSRIAWELLNRFEVKKILIDVNVKNLPSLRIMEKIGLKVDHKMLYIAIFGRLAVQLVLKKYA